MPDEMNGYGLAAVIIQSVASLAWPAAIVASVYIFRSKLGELLPRLQIKHGESQVSFARIGELVEQVQEHEVSEINKAAITLSAQPSAATANLTTLSNDEIRIRVEDVALKMRELELRFRRERDVPRTTSDNWADTTAAYLEQSSRQNSEWQTTLLPEAAALREEMLRRLGENAPSDSRHASHTIEYGSLAGASPLGEAALYLEQLARSLIGPSDRPPRLVSREMETDQADPSAA